MKHFYTAGPVNQPDAYKIDPLSRWDTEVKKIKRKPNINGRKVWKDMVG